MVEIPRYEKIQFRLSLSGYSLNFPMVLPYLSGSPPLTFRSNNTIILTNTTSPTALKGSSGIITKETKAK